MERMKNDMFAIWTDFADDLETKLEMTNRSVDRAFSKAVETALSTYANNLAAESTRNAMRTITGILRHRKDLAVHGIEQAIDNFFSDLSTLHTNMFSFIRTAFIGRLMENTYHAASMEYGKSPLLPSPDLLPLTSPIQAVAATAVAKT